MKREYDVCIASMPSIHVSAARPKKASIIRSIPRALMISIALLSCLLIMSRPAAAATCSSLTNLSLPKTTITLAQSYTAGETISGTTLAPVDLCRVAGTVKPGEESNVHFEVWIPTDGGWNGRYQQIGNAVSRGYAAAGTDDGTSGPPSGAPSFIGNRDVLLDYGYRAIKATTDDSKAVISAHHGSR